LSDRGGFGIESVMLLTSISVLVGRQKSGRRTLDAMNARQMG
jgi:hypothetical protein